MRDSQEERHVRAEEVPALSSTSSKEKHALEENGGHPKSPAHRWIPFTTKGEAFALSIVALCVLPIALLAPLAPRLSTKLSNPACLPDGQFVLPGTVSIWHPAYIFTITLPFGTRYGSNWTYAHVKVIDLIWDVLIGRGGQVLLIWIAYWVFHRSLLHIMQTQAVSYRTYCASAFDTGLLSSLGPYLSGSVSWKKKSLWKVRRIYAAMMLTTLYIVAMPTLFSAMTGYTPVFTPSIETVHGIYRESATKDYCETLGQCSITPCEDLYPVWGIVWDSDRLDITRHNVTVEEWGAPYYVDTWETQPPGDLLHRYYKKYEADYKAASNDPDCISHTPHTNLSSCKPLSKPSYLAPRGNTRGINLPPPLLNIEVLGTTGSNNLPKAFECSTNGLKSVIFYTHDLLTGKYGTRGLCTAGPYYQWGFSFLLLFIVALLNLCFAIVMYWLWIHPRRNGDLRGVEEVTNPRPLARAAQGIENWRRVNSPSHLRHALNIADQAEKRYGSDVREWPSWKLEEKIWKGREGMRVSDVKSRPLLDQI